MSCQTGCIGCGCARYDTKYSRWRRSATSSSHTSGCFGIPKEGFVVGPWGAGNKSQKKATSITKQHVFRCRMEPEFLPSDDVGALSSGYSGPRLSLAEGTSRSRKISECGRAWLDCAARWTSECDRCYVMIMHQKQACPYTKRRNSEGGLRLDAKQTV